MCADDAGVGIADSNVSVWKCVQKVSLSACALMPVTGRSPKIETSVKRRHVGRKLPASAVQRR